MERIARTLRTARFFFTLAAVFGIAAVVVYATDHRPTPGPTVQRTGAPPTPFITISTGIR